MDITVYLHERKAMIDAALQSCLDVDRSYPEPLAKAIRYSVLAGGKRIRPILTMAAAAAVGGTESDVLPCACALEMIHTFSLIHDDLPAMDNDDLRRGVPTNHKMFGEAMAILAGDGLLAEAFRCLTDPAFAAHVPSDRLIAVIRDIAEATGPRGMVGGQVLDIQAEGRSIGRDEVMELHQRKTGALIRVAVTSGARLGGATTAQLEALRNYGNAVGLAFQIADDLLGAEGVPAELGKPVGSDAARHKSTYPAVVGAAAAREAMGRFAASGISALASFNGKAEPLRLLAQYIRDRRN